MFLVYDTTTGKAISYGTVLADPMPDTYTVQALTDDETGGVNTGRLIWNPATLAFDINPHQAPLDAVGALATLLAVTGAVTVQDAANAVGLTPNDLIAEAQAWAVAQN